MSKVYLSMEVPVQLLDLVDPLIDGHFVIATELLKNQEYWDWYKAYGRRPREQRNFVMLDNGAYEAEAVSPECLHELANSIQADLVWAPDTLHDGDKSYRQTEDFLSYVGREVPYQVGIIPQGKTADEIINNYLKLEEHYEGAFTWVGLSFKNPRAKVVKFIKDRPIHYLGLCSLDEIKTWPDNVISMDTVKPIKAAYYCDYIEEMQRGLGIWNASMEVSRLDLVYRNIARLHAALTK